MSAEIQKAVFDLFCICHDVTQAGHYEAYLSYAGNTNGIYARVYDRAEDRTVFNQHYYLDGITGEGDPDLLDNLRALSDRVSEFLLPAQQEAA